MFIRRSLRLRPLLLLGLCGLVLGLVFSGSASAAPGFGFPGLGSAAQKYADLTLTATGKTMTDVTQPGGQVAQVTYTLSNPGPGPAKNVTVSISVPAFARITVAAPSLGTTTIVNAQPSGNGVTWKLDMTQPVPETDTLTITIATTTPGVLVPVKATVTSDQTKDPQALRGAIGRTDAKTSNLAFALPDASALAELHIAPAPPAPGAPPLADLAKRFALLLNPDRVTVVNTGSTMLTNVQVKLGRKPAGSSSVLTLRPGDVRTVFQGNYDQVTNIWTVTNLAPGAMAAIDVAPRPAPGHFNERVTATITSQTPPAPAAAAAAPSGTVDRTASQPLDRPKLTLSVPSTERIGNLLRLTATVSSDQPCGYAIRVIAADGKEVAFRIHSLYPLVKHAVIPVLTASEVSKFRALGPLKIFGLTRLEVHVFARNGTGSSTEETRTVRLTP